MVKRVTARRPTKRSTTKKTTTKRATAKRSTKRTTNKTTIKKTTIKRRPATAKGLGDIIMRLIYKNRKKPSMAGDIAPSIIISDMPSPNIPKRAQQPVIIPPQLPVYIPPQRVPNPDLSNDIASQFYLV